MKRLDDIKDWSDVTEHQKVGEILMQSGKLSLKDLGIALDIQKFEKSLPHMHLGDILLEMKVISSEELQMSLVLQSQIDEFIGKRS